MSDTATSHHRTRLTLAEALGRATEVSRDVVAAEAATVDELAAWPERGIRSLLDAGLGGLVVSSQHGGSGHGLLATAQVCEAIGRECASTALCFGMHLVASAVMDAKATRQQIEQFLLPICAGEHLTTLAVSEPGSGAHFYLPQTAMATAGDSFVINGTKSFVTNGGHANSYVISTVTAEPGAPPGEFSCCVVPGDAPGLEWKGAWHGFGMRGNSSLTVLLKDVRVPASNLLGNTGDQIWYVFEVVAPYFLMAMAGTYLGLAEAALEEARTHVSRREYEGTGARLSQQQVIQHRIGTMWGSVARCRALLYRAAALGDTRPADALLDVLSAKAEIADTAVAIANEAMTLTGGLSYAANSKLSRLLRDARASHVMAPTTDLLRIWTGRAFLGLPLLSE
jgi:alkylation response protein AidB-like acyl-CoA dehydrogenase